MEWLNEVFGVALLALLIGIYKIIRDKTRVKTENEETKVNFLESKFSYLNNQEFNVKAESSNQELNEILKTFKYNGCFKGKVSKIKVDIPYTKKSTWRVYAFIDRGPLGADDKIGIFSILDNELEELIN